MQELTEFLQLRKNKYFGKQTSEVKVSPDLIVLGHSFQAERLGFPPCREEEKSA